MIKQVIITILFSAFIYADDDLYHFFGERNRSMLWGTYRSNLYFGARTRTPSSIQTGLMWYDISNYQGWHDIRHSCEQDNGVDRWGYIEHDGIGYGKQVLKDSKSGYRLSTEFVKKKGGMYGGDWVLRVKGKATRKSSILSVMFYVYHDKSNDKIRLTYGKDNMIEGFAPDLDDFRLFVRDAFKNNTIPEDKVFQKHDLSNIRYVGLSVDRDDELYKIKDHVKAVLQEYGKSNIMEVKQKESDVFPPAFQAMLLPNVVHEGSNVFVFQKIFKEDFAMDIVFASKSSRKDQTFHDLKDLTSENVGLLLHDQSLLFNQKFMNVFGNKDLTETEVKMGKFALSNLLGGISYFYGKGLVYQNENVAETNAYELFTDVPCRPFFPRGFLWDSGFHNLIISKWDVYLSLDIIQSWYNTIDENGWIAREQILGAEARSKVPKEFQVQNSEYANPPTFLLTIREIFEKPMDSFVKEILKRLYPRLKSHFGWYRKHQKGTIHKSYKEKINNKEIYKWKGRTADHTLTSGLDDYPRANVPNDFELHVDLQSWMTFGAMTMRDYAKVLGIETDVSYYENIYNDALANLNQVFWNEKCQCYNDITLVNGIETYTFIEHIGYISIFPFLFGFTPEDKLSHVLSHLSDASFLYSDFGILSLSRSSQLFGSKENYWRGPIWININYLIITSLLKYSQSVSSPSLKAQCKDLYSKFRLNLINNMSKEFKRTGSIWEQYSPLNGQGQRSRPFTGWSSLVVLLLNMPK